MTSRRDRSALYLSGVALAALALSLALALASVALQRALATHPRAERTTANRPAAPARPRNATTQAPIVAPRFPAQTPSTAPAGPPSLWTVLTPWALAVDAFAVVGIAAVLAVRRAARRGHGPRP